MAQRFKDIIAGEKPVLVDFHAEWCGPCKMVAPVIKELSSEFTEKVRILKVDVDKNPAAAADYGIQGVPTFILFKNGKIVWRQSGAIPALQLRTVLQQYA